MRHLAWTSWKTAALLAVVTSSSIAQSAPVASSSPGSESVAPIAERAYLGVFVEGAADAGGLQLAEIVEGSPAAKAGLQAGDVIVALGDTTIGSEEELRAAIAALGVGSKVKITFVRDGEKRRTSARLAAAPEEMESEESDEADAEVVELVDVTQGEPTATIDLEGLNGLVAVAPSSDSGWMGVQLQPTDEGKASVLAVIDGSPAQAAGLEAGDVIERVDADEVESVEGLVGLVQSRKAGDVVKLRVRRGDKVLKPKVTLGQRAANLELPGMGGGMGGAMAPLKVDVAPAPEPPSPPDTAGAAPPGRVRARLAQARDAQVRAQAQAKAAAEQAEQAAQHAAKAAKQAQQVDLQQTIADLKRQVDEWRRRCEQQERALQRVREALGNAGGGGGSGGGNGREPSIDGGAAWSGGLSLLAPATTADGEASTTWAMAPLEAGQYVVSSGDGNSFTLMPATIAADGDDAAGTVETITLDGQNLTLHLGGEGQPAQWLTVDGATLTLNGAGECTASGGESCTVMGASGESCTGMGASDECCATGASAATAECTTTAECCEAAQDGPNSVTVFGGMGDDGSVQQFVLDSDGGAVGEYAFVVDGGEFEGAADGNVLVKLGDGHQLEIVKAHAHGGDGQGPHGATIVVRKGDGGEWVTTPSVKGRKIAVQPNAHPHGAIRFEGTPAPHEDHAPQKVRKGQRIELKQDQVIAPKKAVAGKRVVVGTKLPAAHAGERLADGRCSDCQAPCCQQGGDERPAEFGRGGGLASRAPAALRWRIAPPAPHAAPGLRWRMLQSGRAPGAWSTEPQQGAPAKFRVRGVKAPAAHPGTFELRMAPAVLGEDEGALQFELPCEIECTVEGECPMAGEECVIECDVDGDVQCEVQCDVQCDTDCDDDGGK